MGRAVQHIARQVFQLSFSMDAEAHGLASSLSRQQYLYFLPLPQGHGSFAPILIFFTGCCLTVLSAAAARRRDLRDLLCGVIVLLRAQAKQIQAADGLLADGVDHAVEHREALALIRHDRIGLPVGAQADALLQVLHGVDVVHPVLVDDAQQDDALDLAHALRAELLLARGIGLAEERIELLLRPRRVLMDRAAAANAPFG